MTRYEEERALERARAKKLKAAGVERVFSPTGVPGGLKMVPKTPEDRKPKRSDPSKRGKFGYGTDDHLVPKANTSRRKKKALPRVRGVAAVITDTTEEKFEAKKGERGRYGFKT